MAANFLWVSNAAAQDCADLENNTEYKSLMEKMNIQIQDNDYPAAKKTADNLLKICPTVPSVNYALGKIYQNLGDQKSAHTHFSIATDNTEAFAVPKDVLKSMWYARYESEFPGVVALKTGKIKEYHKKSYQKLNDQLVETETEELAWAKNVMWSGAGIGIAGVVMAVAGGVVMGVWGSYDGFKLNLDNIQKDNQDYYFDLGREENTKYYTAGSVLLGVGIGATVAGAIMAGIGGYKYTQLKAEKNIKDKLDTSINVSYNSITFNMTF